MADRLILGKGRATNGTDFGFWVSKPGENVFTTNAKNLLFDSDSMRTGQIYGGGTQSSISSSGLTWTSGSKPTLTYIPAYIQFEQQIKIHSVDEFFGGSGGTIDIVIQNALAYTWEYSNTKITPRGSGDDGSDYGRTDMYWHGEDSQVKTSRTSNAVSFMILRIPNGFGFMGNTYLQANGVSTTLPSNNHPSLGDSQDLWE